MKILLAVDGSQHAAAATEFLARFPFPRPVKVEVITVVNPPEVVVTAQSEMWYPQYLEHQEEFASQTLQRAQTLLKKSSKLLSESGELDDEEVDVTTHRTMGHIGHCIVDRAADGEFDLIVVAAKGHSAFERVLLGSVSDYVATHAKCSVLVVRPTLESSNANELNEITVAVDEREISAQMVDHLCRFPFGASHRFHVVTASVKLEVFREDILASTMEEAARRRSEAKNTADAAADRLRKCGGSEEPSAACDHRVTGDSIEVEHVGDGLVQYAEQVGSDLIVLGDSQRGVVSRFLLGSTSRYVLRHVHCSVLIIRSANVGQSAG